MKRKLFPLHQSSRSAVVLIMCALGALQCTKLPFFGSDGSAMVSGTSAEPSPEVKPLAWQPRKLKFGPSPSGGYELSDAEIDALVNAFVEVKNAFWFSSDNYRKLPSGRTIPAAARMDESDFQECLAQGYFDKWSTLMVHYFCHFPGSKRGVHPNIRACLLRFGVPNPTQSITVGGAPINLSESPFQTAYDICSFFPLDRTGFKKDGAPLEWTQFSVIELPNLKSYFEAKEPVGPFAWIHAHQEDVFKYIMFGSKCSLSATSQWRVLQKVHGRGQYVDTTGCFMTVESPPSVPK